MIGEKINGENGEGLSGKHCQSQAFKVTSIILGLSILLTTNSVFAKNKFSRIESVYFNSDNSFVLEFAENSKLNIGSFEQLRPKVYKLTLYDSKLSHSVDNEIKNKSLSLDLDENRSIDRSIFKGDDLVEILINTDKSKGLELSSRPILDGLAYEIHFDENLNNERDEETHHLSIIESYKKPDKSEPQADNFLASLDPQLVQEVMDDEVFQKETFAKLDSMHLSQIGAVLSTKGQAQDAVRAYRKALSVDPENLQARLGLAHTTGDKVEKLDSYLASINNQALLEIGDQWYETGTEKGDAKVIAKAFLSYQFAILKEPKNPNYRFKYAKALEGSGPGFFEESSKRYLEAAALAKRKYNEGDKKIELVLRNSTEALIRTLSMQGKQDDAIKYCNSYISLGFRKFSDGKPILGIIKELNRARNPFKRG